MLRSLHMKDVGPAPSFDLALGERLSVLTGDNGLGKSFVLDVAWWALTGTWVGRPVLPQKGKEDEAEIGMALDLPTLRSQPLVSRFRRPLQDWEDPVRHPGNVVSALAGGLSAPSWLRDHPWVPVIYARADGGFSVWDPARNYLARPSQPDDVRWPVPYHFDVRDLWYGLERGDKTLSNGLIRDWTTWQLEARDDANHPFHLMAQLLRALSHPDEPMVPGSPVRLYHDDARRYPTVEVPYGSIPVIHASAGMKRILGLAYLLTWAWTEHVTESMLLGRTPAASIVLVMDEIESHLHPKWQRHILPKLLDVLTGLGPGIKPQVMATTHSPLVLASLEPHFREDEDKLFLFELRDRDVSLREVPWAKRGDAVSWLTSPIFGLEQARSPEAERAIEAAYDFMAGRLAELPEGLRSADQIDRELRRLLPDQDKFWPRWVVWQEKQTA